ncbi:hypothetical protein PR048_030401 [Dryococelus australis]|uniref:Reverse transcriptase zinc-binding domain-containing protein n=1 Tax=Dryococelus australis TaxID=614101 RepID=A0ABQ9G8W4_9NEOP|nr:hypothetical protein PR048_030401 [Dryococelus australis]
MSAVMPYVVNRTPAIYWRRPWKILADPNLSSDLPAFGFYNNIVATQQRKYSIHLTADPACPLCGNTDTALHRVISCLYAAAIWQWCRVRVRKIFAMNMEMSATRTCFIAISSSSPQFDEELRPGLYFIRSAFWWTVTCGHELMHSFFSSAIEIVMPSAVPMGITEGSRNWVSCRDGLGAWFSTSVGCQQCNGTGVRSLIDASAPANQCAELKEHFGFREASARKLAQLLLLLLLFSSLLPLSLRARWRSGDSLYSHSGGPGFDSRSGHPDFGFPLFPEIIPGECWDGSLNKAHGRPLPQSLFLVQLAPSLMISLSTRPNRAFSCIVRGRILFATQGANWQADGLRRISSPEMLAELGRKVWRARRVASRRCGRYTGALRGGITMQSGDPPRRLATTREHGEGRTKKGFILWNKWTIWFRHPPPPPPPSVNAFVRLERSARTKENRVRLSAGSLLILARGNRDGRCHWSAGFLGGLPFSQPFEVSMEQHRNERAGEIGYPREKPRQRPARFPHGEYPGGGEPRRESNSVRLGGRRIGVPVTYQPRLSADAGGDGSSRTTRERDYRREWSIVSSLAAPTLADQQARPADVRHGARQIHPHRSEGKPSQMANIFSTSYATGGLAFVDRIPFPAGSLPDFVMRESVPDDAVDRRVFSGIFRFPPLLSALKTSISLDSPGGEKFQSPN